jgi:hypothetical protein
MVNPNARRILEFDEIFAFRRNVELQVAQDNIAGLLDAETSIGKT